MKGRLHISRVSLGDGRSVRTERVIVAGGAWSEKILNPLGFATACSPRPQFQFSVSGPSVEGSWPGSRRGRDRHGRRQDTVPVPHPADWRATLKPIFPQRRMWLGCLDSVAHPIGTGKIRPRTTARLRHVQDGDREAFGTDVLPARDPLPAQVRDHRGPHGELLGGLHNFSTDGLPILTEEPVRGHLRQWGFRERHHEGGFSRPTGGREVRGCVRGSLVHRRRVPIGPGLAPPPSCSARAVHPLTERPARPEAGYFGGPWPKAPRG